MQSKRKRFLITCVFANTQRKLMEKLPQRNLLLPNAPITPFSTTKKSKHPFKQLLSTSGKLLISLPRPPSPRLSFVFLSTTPPQPPSIPPHTPNFNKEATCNSSSVSKQSSSASGASNANQLHPQPLIATASKSAKSVDESSSSGARDG